MLGTQRSRPESRRHRHKRWPVQLRRPNRLDDRLRAFNLAALLDRELSAIVSVLSSGGLCGRRLPARFQTASEAHPWYSSKDSFKEDVQMHMILHAIFGLIVGFVARMLLPGPQPPG